MKAREIMTSNPETVTPDVPVSRVAELMKRLDVGAIPVVADRASRRLVGIVTDRDIAIRHVALEHTMDCPVEDCTTMKEGTDRFLTVRPEDTVDYAMELMGDHQVRRIPVLDDDDRLVGIIALADVAREVGPRAPERVVDLLERMSEPSVDRTPAPAAS
jgi:CBS domain-containing protein